MGSYWGGNETASLVAKHNPGGYAVAQWQGVSYRTIDVPQTLAD